MNEDSFFQVNALENAVEKPTVPILLEHGTSSISVVIEGMSRSLILETGSNVSILQRRISRGNLRFTTLELCGVTGDVLDIKGQVIYLSAERT
jgi:hypothetical protein